MKTLGRLANLAQKLKAKGLGMIGARKDAKSGVEGGIETNNKANAITVHLENTLAR